MTKFFTFLFILLSFSLYGQDYANKEFYLVDSLVLDELSEGDRSLLDSALTLYHKETNPIEKLELLDHISEEVMHDIWFQYQLLVYQKVKKLLELKEYEKNKKVCTIYSGSLNGIGFHYQELGQYDEATEYWEQGLEFEKKKGLAEFTGSFYNNIGYVKMFQGETNSALSFLKKAAKFYKDHNQFQDLHLPYSNMGNIHLNQGDFKTALNYARLSLNLQLKYNDKSGVQKAFGNIGAIHKILGNLDSAQYYVQKSIEISEVNRDYRALANSYNNLGQIYDELGEDSVAIDYYQKAYDFYQNSMELDGYVRILNRLSHWHFKQNNFNEARKFAEEALEMSQKTGLASGIKRNSGILSRIYEQSGMYKKALEMRNLEILMTDSLNSLEAIKSAEEQKAQFEYERQKAIDSKESEKRIALEKKDKEKQKVFTYFSIGGLVLVLGFLFFVYNRLKVTKKQKDRIEEQRKEIEITHLQLTEHHREIQDSIKYAKNIQNAIMPSLESIHRELKEEFVLYLPKDIVAGDFYWMEKLKEDDIVYFAAADCTGHGVPGAMVSVVCSNALSKSLVEEGIKDPGKLLDRTRELVIEQLAKSGETVKDGMDISLCALNQNTGELKWSGAHNPLWIVRGGEIEIEEIKANKQPIGVFANPKPFDSHTINLEKGDSIYIFTDGYSDQFGGENGKKLKSKNFKNLILSVQNETMQNQHKKLLDFFNDWKKNHEQLDDVCVIGIKV